MSPCRILIVGGGVGGTLVANLLARRLKPEEAQVTLLSQDAEHHYQPGWLYVAVDDMEETDLRRPEKALLEQEVFFIHDAAERFDLERRRVWTRSGEVLPYDWLVIATGSQLDLERIPGLQEGAHHFYSLVGARNLQYALRAFRGGRVVIGIGGMPFKCPVAPLEFTFLLDVYLRRRGLRGQTELVYTFPIGRCFPIESVAELAQRHLDERGIRTELFFDIEGIDPERRVIFGMSGDLAYDLAVIIPPHRGAEAVLRSGIGDDEGWIPTDRYTLQLEGVEGVWVIGDATNIPISKAGSTAHYQARVVADRIVAQIRGQEPTARYDGHVQCFLELGDGKATLLDFDYEHPPEPPRPTRFYHLAKKLFNRAYWYLIPTGRV
ncbi:MAG: NAD(P)/FAD-dependent oxidoreductase [Bacteroidetes bacterium]|nr:NAD(P)/FAD-dependent oxidoreductase [Rhodothermia bacterium]MCS7156054.1 NAD(P)/FAD-dependent oxidoreductase [Bacteroidota bacterium]MCX7907742.1 NAD(P)/FAD-dependent oxidoreductase [Bacteroidota bacterium]MDW8137871.1 FAD/NAD(P)-binding oxidoreductase [Bacteroidota bacterium]MDW8286278.1 FAD/NAD(P)-binding oxidoreductase [Bacteroidota bacterium]